MARSPAAETCMALLLGAAGRRRRGAGEPELKSHEAEHYLGDSGSRLVFAWQACRPERV